MKRVIIIFNKTDQMSFDCDEAKLEDSFLKMTNVYETGYDKKEEEIGISALIIKSFSVNTIKEKIKK